MTEAVPRSPRLADSPQGADFGYPRWINKLLTVQHMEIGASRDTLVQLANDLLSTFAGTTFDREHVVTAQTEADGGGVVTIRFSNRDIEDDEVPAGAVYVEVDG